MSSSLFIQRFGKTKSLTKRSTKKYLEEALYRNLFKNGGSDVTVRQNVNQFIKSRKKAYKWEVDHTLKILRNRKCYAPALKVLFFFIFFLHFLDLNFVFLLYMMYDLA